MLFLVVEKVDGHIPEQALANSAKATAYFNALKKNGKLIAHYHFAGIPGGALILNVASNEELGHCLIQSPFYPYTSRTIYPLMEEETMVQSEKKLLSEMISPKLKGND